MSDFISVNKLVEKVQQDKNGRESRFSRLQAILESRKQKRETWDPEKKENYQKFLLRLKLAHDNYVKALKTKIVECAEKILQNNINAKFFKLWDPQNLDCELEGFSEFTIYRGFWNSEKKKNLLKNQVKVFLKFMLQVSVAQICTLIMERMREEFHL